MKKLLLTTMAAATLALILTGCAGPNSLSKVIQAAGTANKKIHAEFSGWNAHMVYESEPLFPTPTNAGEIVLTPKTTTTVTVQPR